ncbi:epoxide hydrolase 3-like [Wolffia australiana]
MESIHHRMLRVNGIVMHVAEKGSGPSILLLHGFPELWYSWRHQISCFAARGFRAIAPDLRGYGDTEVPPSPASYSILHIVGDLIALLDVLAIDKVFLVGHDWGAIVAWNLCMFRPDRVKATVSLSVPFRFIHPAKKPVETLRTMLGDNFYICRFQVPGAMEAEFSKAGARAVLRKIMAPSKSPQEEPLPSWLSNEDLDYLASKFEKSGFSGALNYYRSMDLNWELTMPWAGAQIKVPAMFIVGDDDIVYKLPGVQDYIHNGEFKRDVPFLQETVIMKSVGHFANQIKPNEVNDYICGFINKFLP